MANEEDADVAGGWLFAMDLRAYAGEWIAAIPSKIVAHGPTLREVRKRAEAGGHDGRLRYYAVPGDLQAT